MKTFGNEKEELKRIFETDIVPFPYIEGQTSIEGQYPVAKIERNLGICGEFKLEENEEQNPTGREVNRGGSAGSIINCYKDVTAVLRNLERILIREHVTD